MLGHLGHFSRAAHQGSSCAIQGPLQQHQRHSVGKQWLAEQPRPLALKGDPPQLRIDLSDPCNVSLGPSPVLRVRCYGPGSAFLGSWSSAQASVQPTPGLSLERSLLAGRAPTCLGEASPARPVDPETRCAVRFDKILVVSFCHCSFPPFTWLDVQSSLLVAA